MFADRKDDAQRMAKVMANGKILFHGFCSLWRQFFFSQSDFQFSHSNCLFPLLRRDGLYHCDYCSKDLSTSLRIKCAVCPDFDLCLECFSVGAEIKPHASDHAYRVVDNLSFPVYTLDWGADEELLLLEGVEFFGLGNWAKVAEHVGKHADDCKAHYFAVYVETETFPQPKPTSEMQGVNIRKLIEERRRAGAERIALARQQSAGWFVCRFFCFFIKFF